MAQKIRLWEVTAENTVSEVPSDDIPREKHLEDWLESNIALLDPDLLVIGRQVPTDSGYIDLLCIDAGGAVVVVELKRRQTTCEVTAQVLDYASWMKDADIIEIADDYLGSKGQLKRTFEAKFGDELPEVLDEHRSLVVAESVDDSTERIVRYLADWGVPISVATVQHFKDSAGRQMLAQVYLVETGISRAAPRRSLGDRRQALADDLGIRDVFAKVRSSLRGALSTSGTSREVVWYRAQTSDSRKLTVLKVFLEPDGMRFKLHVDRVAEHLGMSREQIESVLPANAHEDNSVRDWRGASEEEKQSAIGLAGTFHTTDEVAKFAQAVQAAARNRP